MESFVAVIIQENYFKIRISKNRVFPLNGYGCTPHLSTYHILLFGME